MNKWKEMELEMKGWKRYVKCWKSTPVWQHWIWGVRNQEKGGNKRNNQIMNDRQWYQRRSRGNMRNAEGEHHIEIIETQWSGRKTKIAKRKKEMKNKWQAIGFERKGRCFWGKRGVLVEELLSCDNECITINQAIESCLQTCRWEQTEENVFNRGRTISPSTLFIFSLMWHRDFHPIQWFTFSHLSTLSVPSFEIRFKSLHLNTSRLWFDKLPTMVHKCAHMNIV